MRETVSQTFFVFMRALILLRRDTLWLGERGDFGLSSPLGFLTLGRIGMAEMRTESYKSVFYIPKRNNVREL